MANHSKLYLYKQACVLIKPLACNLFCFLPFPINSAFLLFFHFLFPSILSSFLFSLLSYPCYPFYPYDSPMTCDDKFLVKGTLEVEVCSTLKFDFQVTFGTAVFSNNCKNCTQVRLPTSTPHIPGGILHLQINKFN